jgi:hypothetical protein
MTMLRSFSFGRGNRDKAKKVEAGHEIGDTAVQPPPPPPGGGNRVPNRKLSRSLSFSHQVMRPPPPPPPPPNDPAEGAHFPSAKPPQPKKIQRSTSFTRNYMPPFMAAEIDREVRH